MRTPRPWRKFWSLFLTPATLLVLNGCKEAGIADPDDDDEQVTLTLQNLDDPVLGLPVHLLVGTETFPTGRLELGGSRTVIFDARPNEDIEVRAGRNGSIIATKSCKCTSACDNGGDGTARVEWSGSALVCAGW